MWGIDNEDLHIYYRSGVSRDEPSGKLWQCMDLPYEYIPSPDHSIASSSYSLSQYTATTASLDNSAQLNTADMSERIADNTREMIESEIGCDDGHSAVSLNNDASAVIESKIEPNSTAETDDCKEDSQTAKDSKPSKKSRWFRRIKESTSMSKFYVPLSDTDELKRSSNHSQGEQTFHNVVQHLEKNLSKGLEDGMNLAKDLSKNLERSLERNIPVVKRVTRRKDPENSISCQYSKDTDELGRSSDELAKGIASMTTDDSVQSTEAEVCEEIATERLSLQMEPPTKADCSENIDIEQVVEGEVAVMQEQEGVDDALVEEEYVDWMQFETEPDDGEIHWLWLSGTACWVPDEGTIRQWFIKDSGVLIFLNNYRIRKFDIVLMMLKNM